MVMGGKVKFVRVRLVILAAVLVSGFGAGVAAAHGGDVRRPVTLAASGGAAVPVDFEREAPATTVPAPAVSVPVPVPAPVAAVPKPRVTVPAPRRVAPVVAAVGDPREVVWVRDERGYCIRTTRSAVADESAIDASCPDGQPPASFNSGTSASRQGPDDGVWVWDGERCVHTGRAESGQDHDSPECADRR